MSQPLRSFPPEYVPLGNDDVSLMSPSPILRKLSIDEQNAEDKGVKIVPSSFRRTVVRFWLTEWISWLIAFGAMAGIVAVLVVFNGRSLPDWPFGITLSALVSLLATIATVALMVPISSGIGQAQWIWFTRERRLRDFDLIDEASRSPFGSLRLLARGRGGFFALAGALLTIIILAVAPFSQQVVHYAEKTVNNTAASLSVATEYNTFDQGTILNTDADLSMKAAVQRALLDLDANKNTFNVFPECSTGNCTWDKYTSLSVCGRCADVSPDIKITNNNGTTSAALPNNITLDYVPQTTKIGFIAMTINTTSKLLDNEIKSLKFTEWTMPLLDVFTLIPQFGDSSDNLYGPFASECVLQFCVQDYSSKSVNGKFSETALGEPQYLDSIEGSTQLNVSGKNYSVEINTMKGVFEYLQNLFQSEVHQQNSLSPIPEWPDDVSQSIFTWTNQSADHLPTELFENLAASMSLNIRSKSNETQSGIASATKAVVSVNWYWMILPFAILALIFFYLIAIIVVSRARGLHPWRCSILAPLMHGVVDDSSRNLVSGVSRLEEMEALAEVLKAKSVYSSVEGEERSHLGVSVRGGS